MGVVVLSALIQMPFLNAALEFYSVISDDEDESTR